MKNRDIAYLASTYGVLIMVALAALAPLATAALAGGAAVGCAVWAFMDWAVNE